MRKIIEFQPHFRFNILPSLALVEKYNEKYTKIELLLEENPDILSTIHMDLEKFGGTSGRSSKHSTEQIFRMLIVKVLEGESYRRTIIRVSGSEFLRNFTRIGTGQVMDFTFLSKANKCISSSTWRKVNDIFFQSSKTFEKISSDQLRVDSTLCESNIHFPTDCSLLWDSYRVVSRTIRACTKAEPFYDLCNRFHERKIKKLYTYISTHSSNKSKSVKRKIKMKFKVLIERVDQVVKTAVKYLGNANNHRVFNTLADNYLQDLTQYLTLIKKVIGQSIRRVLKGEVVPANERLFSIFEEHTELIKRGKAGSPVEFGHMVTIGQTKEKFISYYDVLEEKEHDSTRTDILLENHKHQFGSYPKKFAADKNYYKNMDKVREWEDKIETFSICKKGKRNQEEYDREHTEDFQNMQKFRAGSEGSISVLKRAFGLRKCFNKGFKSFAASIGSLVFCHNLVLLTRL